IQNQGMEVLKQLKNIASLGNKYNLTQESQRSLQYIKKYKQNSMDLIINEEILQGQSDSQEVNPLIFTKKQTNLLRQSKQTPQWMIAFENYLNIVCQMYYKKILIQKIYQQFQEKTKILILKAYKMNNVTQRKKKRTKNKYKANIKQLRDQKQQ
ncbi:hypothetical protein IMG5_122990, partial [Ichthyophthirius multifiliis]